MCAGEPFEAARERRKEKVWKQTGVVGRWHRYVLCRSGVHGNTGPATRQNQMAVDTAGVQGSLGNSHRAEGGQKDTRRRMKAGQRKKEKEKKRVRQGTMRSKKSNRANEA